MLRWSDEIIAACVSSIKIYMQKISSNRASHMHSKRSVSMNNRALHKSRVDLQMVLKGMKQSSAVCVQLQIGKFLETAGHVQ